MNYPNEDLTAQRIAYWIECLEKQAEELLPTTYSDDLSEKERFNLLIKYLSLLQRFLLLAQKSKPEVPSNDALRILNSIKAYMRGELSMEMMLENEKGNLYEQDRDSSL